MQQVFFELTLVIKILVVRYHYFRCEAHRHYGVLPLVRGRESFGRHGLGHGCRGHGYRGNHLCLHLLGGHHAHVERNFRPLEGVA